MLSVMEHINDFSLGSPNPRSLANRRMGNKKRKKADVVRDRTLDVMIMVAKSRK